MFLVVTGGSGSGKSFYAEQQILALGEQERFYIATMRCADAESERRVQRHRAMRAGKRFETLECPVNLAGLSLPQGSVALLECMSNLTANEFFDGRRHTPRETADRIMLGVRKIRDYCSHLVVVTNEVFSDGVDYDEQTLQYLQCLAMVNCDMAREADRVVEVVYGLPVLHGEQSKRTQGGGR